MKQLGIFTNTLVNVRFLFEVYETLKKISRNEMTLQCEEFLK